MLGAGSRFWPESEVVFDGTVVDDRRNRRRFSNSINLFSSLRAAKQSCL